MNRHPLVAALLVQATPLPQEYGEALLIVFGATTGGLLIRELIRGRDRAETRVDTCHAELKESTKLVSELTGAFRELKEIILDGTSTNPKVRR